MSESLQAMATYDSIEGRSSGVRDGSGDGAIDTGNLSRVEDSSKVLLELSGHDLEGERLAGG